MKKSVLKDDTNIKYSSRKNTFIKKYNLHNCIHFVYSVKVSQQIHLNYDNKQLLATINS